MDKVYDENYLHMAPTAYTGAYTDTVSKQRTISGTDEIYVPSECESCVHSNVCSYKKDYEMLIAKIESLRISEQDGDRVKMTPIKNYEFVKSISIKCKHHYTHQAAIKHYNKG